MTPRARRASSASPAAAAPPPAPAAPSRLLLLGAAAALLSVLLLLASSPGALPASLAGAKVVVTGASGGIGAELAREYAGAGASVLLVARSGDKLAAVAADCPKPGSCRHFAQDLSADGAAELVVAAAKAELGGLDTLVLNHIASAAGGYDAAGWPDQAGNIASLKEMLQVNTVSYVELATAALPALSSSGRAGGGAIVVVSSVAGKMGLPAVAGYAASKHALHGFFDSLRHDLHRAGAATSVTLAVLSSIDTANARKGTAGALPNVQWHAPAAAAAAIIRGGEARAREVYFPVSEVLPTVLLRPLLPETIDGVVRAMMSPEPLSAQLAEAVAGALPAGAQVLEGLVQVLLVYGVVLLLHIVVPARSFDGYVAGPDGAPVQYRLNGIPVMALSVAAACHLPPPSGGADSFLAGLAGNFGGVAAAAFLLGLGCSALLFLRGRALHTAGLIPTGRRCAVRNEKPVPRARAASEAAEFGQRTAGEHFYCGFEFNPCVFGVDSKMFLYLAGAILLQLHVLSAAKLQTSAGGKLSWAMAAYVGCFTWFLWEYLLFEDIHTYTYDLFAERLGFKLTWGCLFFYPHFYCVGVWAIVAAGPRDDISAASAASIAGLFLCGWCLTRGANLQKYRLKREVDGSGGGGAAAAASDGPGALAAWLLVGWVDQRTVAGSDGRLLCSGWWGISRHVNYLGEIVQAVALALPGYLCSGSYVPFLYPLYYVALFVPRQQDDDVACAAKYGVAWERFEKLVPWRILPGVY
jgi:delta14-sterol reductase